MKHELRTQSFTTITKRLTFKFGQGLFVALIICYIYILIADTNIKWTLPKMVVLWGIALMGIFVSSAIFNNLFKKKV